MALPVKLGPGMLSIYGDGSINGIMVVKDSANVVFGVINDAYYIQGGYTVGQSVLYNRNDSVEIMYDNTSFYIVPSDKIVLVENPLEEL